MHVCLLVCICVYVVQCAYYVCNRSMIKSTPHSIRPSILVVFKLWYIDNPLPENMNFEVNYFYFAFKQGLTQGFVSSSKTNIFCCHWLQKIK